MGPTYMNTLTQKTRTIYNNKYRRYCIATDVIVFQQYNELYSKYNELYSKYNELYSKNKNWIANAIIVLIPPKKCKKTKNVSGRWPSLCCTIIETKIQLLKKFGLCQKKEIFE